MACCSANTNSADFGNIRDFVSAQEIVNTDAMKQIRVDMLAGKQNPACSQCYQEESHGLTSFRQHKNNDIVDLTALLDNTQDDGTLNDFKIQYWDSRFSNVCNYKCRMCGPEYSHTWAEETYRNTGRKDFVIYAHGRQDYWADIIGKYGDLTELKEVYFAGGEALYQSEHWQMLDHLDHLGQHNIRITYTTNLSRLSFGKFKLEDYLTRFTNVLFIVSLDAVGPLLEYIRSGASWETTQKNIKTILPLSRLKFNIVITVYNILHLSELLDFAYNNTTNFLGTDLTVAHEPMALNITNLPISLKDLASDRLRSSTKYPDLKDKIDGVINYMYDAPVASWHDTIIETNKLDKIRNESVLDVVPEFKDYWVSA
jgi:signal peptidase I